MQAVRRGAPNYDEDEEVPLDARPSTSTVGCPLKAWPISPLSEVLAMLHSMAPSFGVATARVPGAGRARTCGEAEVRARTVGAWCIGEGAGAGGARARTLKRLFNFPFHSLARVKPCKSKHWFVRGSKYRTVHPQPARRALLSAARLTHQSMVIETNFCIQHMGFGRSSPKRRLCTNLVRTASFRTRRSPVSGRSSRTHAVRVWLQGVDLGSVPS